MKKNIPLLRHALISGMLLFIVSCNVTPELTESPVASSSVGSANPSTSALGISVFPVLITFDRVSIFTTSSSSVSGTVIVEITNKDGSTVLGSSALEGNIMTGSRWTTFYFAPFKLIAGTTYRIQVRRSVKGDIKTDFMHWLSSSGSTDVYKKGTSGKAIVYPYDMTFVTYSGGYVDQQQTEQTRFWALNKFVQWQEFVPEKIGVINP